MSPPAAPSAKAGRTARTSLTPVGTLHGLDCDTPAISELSLPDRGEVVARLLHDRAYNDSTRDSNLTAARDHTFGGRCAEIDNSPPTALFGDERVQDIVTDTLVERGATIIASPDVSCVRCTRPGEESGGLANRMHPEFIIPILLSHGEMSPCDLALVHIQAMRRAWLGNLAAGTADETVDAQQSAQGARHELKTASHRSEAAPVART